MPNKLDATNPPYFHAEIRLRTPEENPDFSALVNDASSYVGCTNEDWFHGNPPRTLFFMNVMGCIYSGLRAHITNAPGPIAVSRIFGDKPWVTELHPLKQFSDLPWYDFDDLFIPSQEWN